MRYILPILLFAFPAFAQRSGFIYNFTDSISVTTTAKINGGWDTLTAVGELHSNGIADCKNAKLIENRSEITFDTVYFKSQKVLPAFSFAKFDVKINAATGFGAIGFLQLEEELSFDWFTRCGLWVSQFAGYFDKIRYGFIGGISFVLLSTK